MLFTRFIMSPRNRREVKMKKVLTLCFLFFFVSSLAVQAQTWLTGSVDDALAKAKAQGKLLLVDFHTAGG